MPSIFPHCRECNTSFEITDEDLKFYDRISPIFNNKKYPIPSPTLCPPCRQRRRLAFRNERNLYPRPCDHCQKPMLSIYAPGSKTKRVYCEDCYQKDDWEAMSYGRLFDFKKSFNEQFEALLQEVPEKNLMVLLNENSEYTNQVWHSKNIYLCFDIGYAEDCFYSERSHFVKDVMDCAYCKECELLYECFECQKCYGSIFLEQCEETSESAFSFDLKGCSHCILCTNLRQAEYFVRNKKVSKNEYETIQKELFSGKFDVLESFKKEFSTLKKTAIRKENHNRASENCLGENVLNSKNCQYCFDIFRGEDCKYCYQIDNDVKDSMDCTNGAEGELNYESLSIAGRCNAFCRMWLGKNSLYSMNIFTTPNVENVLGCIGLRHKKYCILNKQYTKEEYEILVPKIIEHMRKTGEWGEFFSPKISPFGYNETVANEEFPLSKSEALKQGFQWSDYETPFPRVEKTISAPQIPNTIQEIPDEILKWAIQCEVTQKPFKIVKQELQFYRKMGVPLPHLHPEERHRRRMILRNPRRLWTRTCSKCGTSIQTTYSPERTEIVYCEKCYLKEVY